MFWHCLHSQVKLYQLLIWPFRTFENGSWSLPRKEEQKDWRKRSLKLSQGKKKNHSMFYRRPGIPLKTRKKIIIHHRLPGWKGLSSRIIWSGLSWQQHKLDKVAQDLSSWILKVFNIGKSSTSLGWVNTVQSVNSSETFTLLSTYYLRQPGQISLLFKL